MACNGEMLQSILFDCDNPAIGGVEEKIWAFNRSEVTFTVDATNPCRLTGFTVEATKNSFVIEAFKNTVDAGSDLVVSETSPDKWNQFVSALVKAKTADEIENIKSMNDLVFVVWTKDKGNNQEGAFEVFGRQTGMYKSAVTRRVNAEDGRYPLEFTNLAGQESTCPHDVLLDTDYATTLAALVASETPTP